MCIRERREIGRGRPDGRLVGTRDLAAGAEDDQRAVEGKGKERRQRRRRLAQLRMAELERIGKPVGADAAVACRQSVAAPPPIHISAPTRPF